MRFFEVIDLKNNTLAKSKTPDLLSSKKYCPSPDLVKVFQKKDGVCILVNHQNKLFYMDKNFFIGYLKKTPSKIPKFLADSGLFVSKKIRIENRIKKYCEVAIVFGLTDDCNLSCKYCYQDSGKKDAMPIEMAEKLIDTISSKWKDFSLYFGGGGEQTLQFKNLKKIVDYGKNINPKAQVVITTNGIFSNNIRHWLLKNTNVLNISCDGPPFIHDKQRPLKNGRPSSKYVEENIRFFLGKKKNIIIKSVVHKESMKTLYKIMNYYHSLGIKNVHFLNLEKRGRIWENSEPLTARQFVLFNLMAKEIGEDLGISVRRPYLRFGKLWPFGCPEFSFHFSTDVFGNLCICPNTSIRSNPEEFDLLKIGKYDYEKNKFIIDGSKLDYLRNVFIKLKKCKSCKYNFICTKCLLKCLKESKRFDKPNEEECQSLKYFLLQYSKFILDKNIFKITPYLLEKNNRLFYKMFFNKFELKLYENNGIDGNTVFKIKISDVDKISKEILDYKKGQVEITLFLISFQFDKKDLNRESGRKIENFLNTLRKNKIYFKIMKPLPRCIFDDNYREILTKFKIPRNCFECLQLFKVCNDDAKVCNQEKNLKIKINDIGERKEIFDLFKRNHKGHEIIKTCEKCVYMIRNVCNGICINEVLS